MVAREGGWFKFKANQATQWEERQREKERQGEELHINQEFLGKYFQNAYLLFNKQMPFFDFTFLWIFCFLNCKFICFLIFINLWGCHIMCFDYIHPYSHSSQICAPSLPSFMSSVFFKLSSIVCATHMFLDAWPLLGGELPTGSHTHANLIFNHLCLH